MNLVIRVAALAGAALMIVVASGCSVRPLLSSQPGAVGSQTAAALSSVAVSPVNSRYAQEVRNQLIFLLRGGAGQVAAPRYVVDLAVSRNVTSAVHVQVGSETEPTAGTVTLTGTYRLRETASGKLVGQGRNEVSAAFDRPPQEYAVLRAQRDAEDRAARELAELMRLALAQDVARREGR